MKNFTIILFVFFIIFLIFSLFVSDQLLLFLLVFMAFLISFICLSEYLGIIRGIFSGLALVILPFLLEYLLYVLKIPYFETPVIKSIATDNINVPLTVSNLFMVFSIPLLFVCALFFAQKMKLFLNVKKYFKTFLTICSSILISINFLVIDQSGITYQNFIKWLAVALLVNLLISRLYKFRGNISDLFKELPIIIFLIIYGTGAMKSMNASGLIIAALLTIIYLVLLYNEYKFKKIKQQFSA
jgi:hypothetical protein